MSKLIEFQIIDPVYWGFRVFLAEDIVRSINKKYLSFLIKEDMMSFFLQRNCSILSEGVEKLTLYIRDIDYNKVNLITTREPIIEPEKPEIYPNLPENTDQNTNGTDETIVFENGEYPADFDKFSTIACDGDAESETGEHLKTEFIEDFFCVNQPR